MIMTDVMISARKSDVSTKRIALRCRVFGHDFAIYRRQWITYNKTERLYEACSRCHEEREAIQTRNHYWIDRTIVR